MPALPSEREAGVFMWSGRYGSANSRMKRGGSTPADQMAGVEVEPQGRTAAEFRQQARSAV